MWRSRARRQRSTRGRTQSLEGFIDETWHSSNCVVTFFPIRNHFVTCCSAFDQLAAVAAQMPSMEQLFTPAVCVGGPDSQPAITQSLQYVRGQVEASIAEFTTWKTQLLSIGTQHSGECN